MPEGGSSKITGEAESATLIRRPFSGFREQALDIWVARALRARVRRTECDRYSFFKNSVTPFDVLARRAKGNFTSFPSCTWERTCRRSCASPSWTEATKLRGHSRSQVQLGNGEIESFTGISKGARVRRGRAAVGFSTATFFLWPRPWPNRKPPS